MKLMTRPASFPARKSTSSNLLMTSSQVSLPSRPKVKNSASGFKVCSCSSFICAVVGRGRVELGDDEAVKHKHRHDCNKRSKLKCSVTWQAPSGLLANQLTQTPIAHIAFN